jgi:hypothetical protein
MFEVGNRAMIYNESRTPFSDVGCDQVTLDNGNNLNTISSEDFSILTDPAVFVISQDHGGNAIGRKWRKEVSDKDRFGYDEI